jgi:hypothetical protein
MWHDPASPPMPAARPEFGELVADLQEHGLLQPIVLHDGSRRCSLGGRSLASLVGDDGAIAEFEADQRQRENLAALERMAAELRREECAGKTASETDTGA